MNQIRNISILIPCYNNPCYDQIVELKEQADAIHGFNYEIIVADDGSTDTEIVHGNSYINQLEHCRYIDRNVNVGRAAIRNFLASLAQYDWLLFLDCEVETATEFFLMNYASMQFDADVICGGVSIGGNHVELNNNLRYMYEKREETNHLPAMRNKHPYKSFRTNNFMIRRSVMAQNAFDNSITTYGYEDVLFGMQLQKNHVSIMHINNPVRMSKFEDNPRFVEKIEEAMFTLHSLRHLLGSYSDLLKARKWLRYTGLSPILNLYFSVRGKAMRESLCGDKPKVKTFTRYKLLYLLRL